MVKFGSVEMKGAILFSSENERIVKTEGYRAVKKMCRRF